MLIPRVAFKNCALLTKCLTHINDEHVDSGNNLDIIMSMYNLIKYSDNFPDTSGSLWKFKRDDKILTMETLLMLLPIIQYFKYKSSFFKQLTVSDNGVFKDSCSTKIFEKFLEMFYGMLKNNSQVCTVLEKSK